MEVFDESVSGKRNTNSSSMDGTQGFCPSAGD
jgi:hypothetical protein